MNCPSQQDSSCCNDNFSVYNRHARIVAKHCAISVGDANKQISFERTRTRLLQSL